TATSDAFAISAWRDEGISIHTLQSVSAGNADVEKTRSLARQLASEWIVLDGWNFDTPYQARLAGEYNVLVFDDTGEGEATGKILVNQNAGAEQWARYRNGTACRRLLGSGYAILRRELRALHKERFGVPPCVLVTFGGADEENYALRALMRLADCKTA